jgi:hypothetical protein
MDLQVSTDLKNLIKLILTPTVYQTIRVYNQQNNGISSIIAGGDAITYYLNDYNLLTKDFDIKFCYTNLEDWASYYTPTPNFNLITSAFERLANQITNYMSVVSTYLNTRTIDVQNRLTTYLNTRYGRQYRVQYNYVPNFDTARLFGTLKEGINTPEYLYLRNLITRNLFSRISLLYECNIFEIRGGIETQVLQFREGLIDAVCWSPINQAYTEYYTTLRPKYSINQVNPRESLFEETITDLKSYQYSLMNRNFSFIQTTDNLCVVSIGFLIWDTIRLLNDSQDFIYKTDDLKLSQWNFDNNLSRDNALNSHKKYLKKYFFIIEGLFSKLRCVEPFRQAAQVCVANTVLNNSTDLNTSITNQLSDMFTSISLPGNLITPLPI